jgi:hypothetical protein
MDHRPLWLFCCLALAGAGCTSQPPEQEKPEYRPTSLSNPDVKTAATLAVREQADRTGESLALETIVDAELKRAGGTDYRLCLDVRRGDSTDFATDSAEVLVHRNVALQLQLMDWQWTDCPAGDDETISGQ